MNPNNLIHRNNCLSWFNTRCLTSFHHRTGKHSHTKVAEQEWATITCRPWTSAELLDAAGGQGQRERGLRQKCRVQLFLIQFNVLKQNSSFPIKHMSVPDNLVTWIILLFTTGRQAGKFSGKSCLLVLNTLFPLMSLWLKLAFLDCISLCYLKLSLKE